MLGPERTARKVSPAIGADPFEALVGALGAEGALEGADARFGGRRQVLVAALAVGSKLEHNRRTHLS